MQLKRCIICEQDLPVTSFHKNAGGKYGVRTDCISCFKTRRANGEVATDFDRKNRRSRERYAENPEKHRSAAAAWQRANPDKVLAIQAKYRESHRDEQRERNRTHVPLWHAKNPGKAVEYAARRRARKLSAVGTFTSDDVSRLYAEQNGNCAYCQCPLNNEYHVEHATPLCRGGSNWPENLRISCPSCNYKKHTKTAEEYMTQINKTTRGD